MTRIFNREQCREVDRRAVEEYGMSSLVLMENAGRNAAKIIARLAGSQPVTICCGQGNNAGDGFVIARHLELRGTIVQMVLFAPPAQFSPDAAVNWKVARLAGIPYHDLSGEWTEADLARLIPPDGWLVDALLGTGIVGAPRAPLDRVIESLNRRQMPTVAIDVPSGLDCDTGHAPGATIRAVHTCTFVAMKPGFLIAGVNRYVGHVDVLNIGVPKRLLETVERAGHGGEAAQ